MRVWGDYWDGIGVRRCWAKERRHAEGIGKVNGVGMRAAWNWVNEDSRREGREKLDVESEGI